MVTVRIHPLVYFLFFLSGLTGKVTPLLLSFGSVLLHETAHLVTALGFGYHPLRIELFPFGGVARMEPAFFNDPVAEAVTALAGPVESIIFALLLRSFAPVLHLTLLEDWTRINLGLGLFNLLPFFPLDGGRILRSVLARSQGYKKATRLMVNGTRLVLYFSGLPLTVLALKRIVPVHLPFLLFFLLLASGSENYIYAYWSQHAKKTVRLAAKGLLPSKVWIVGEQCQAGEILPFLTGQNYHLFFLVDKHGKILGEISEDELMASLQQDNMFSLQMGKIRPSYSRRPRTAGGNEDQQHRPIRKDPGAGGKTSPLHRGRI
ncbi:MAG TPA: site-2 protease family protein [Capillibacterium sp.]